MSNRRFSRPPWPTPTERLMLRAAVLDGDEALAAWREWVQAVPDQDPGPGPSYRLMPQLFRNLRSLGVPAEEIGTLRSVYRRHWYQNQFLFRKTAGVLEALHAEGIETLVLKGAALSVAHYRDLGARPMDDADVLVPRERAREAIAVLEGIGFHAPDVRTHPQQLVPTHPAIGFANGQLGDIDLHWDALWQPGDDEPFWREAVPIELAGVKTLTLCPTDQLLHVCAHAANASAPVRWIGDAMIVLRTSPDIDWDRLMGEARRRRISLSLALMLRYLREEIDARVPIDVVAALGSEPAAIDQRLSYRVGMIPRMPGRHYVMQWYRFRRLKALGRPDAPKGSYFDFIQDLAELESRRELVAHMGRQAGQRAAALVRKRSSAAA